MKIWNFGIIGAGNIADFHAKAIKSVSNAGLPSICGTNPGKVKTLATKYQCKIFDSTNDILQSPDADVVIIATPSGVHLEPAIEAAKYGKHVLCENRLK